MLFSILLFTSAVFVHYLLAAAVSEGYYYLKPTLILFWMCGILICGEVHTITFPKLGIISITILVLILGSSVIPQYLFFATNFQKASQYAKTIQQAEAEGPVYTESQFFVLRWRMPLIDMGDTVSKVEKTGYYGASFSAIFKENLKRVMLASPTYVIHSFVDSPEFAAIVRSRYVKLRCAPRDFAGYPPPCLYRLALRGQ